MNRSATAHRCRACGACCRIEGDVRLADDEPAGIASYLGLSVEDFTAAWTRLTPERRGLMLTEQPDGACVFLDAENACRIHAVKPRQCRDFPEQWRYPNLEAICPGAKAEEHES